METILILRGWGSEVGNWNQFVGLLEGRGYKVYTPDLPGFGINPAPARAWSIDDYVDWVKDYCEKQNLSQFFLLGHSFGGAIAVKFSIKYPEKVKKLILVDSSGIRRKRAKKEIQKKIAHFLNKFSFLPFYNLIKKLAYRTVFRRSDYLLTKGVMKEIYLNVIKEDISEEFSKIFLSTLLIWGKRDKLTPLKDAYIFRDNIRGSKLEIIPKVGHSPHLETPGKLAEIILEFLNK